MPCSINFSVTLDTEILSTVTKDFLKQMTILKSLKSVFVVTCCLLSRNKHFQNVVHSYGKKFAAFQQILPCKSWEGKYKNIRVAFRESIHTCLRCYGPDQSVHKDHVTVPENIMFIIVYNMYKLYIELHSYVVLLMDGHNGMHAISFIFVDTLHCYMCKYTFQFLYVCHLKTYREVGEPQIQIQYFHKLKYGQISISQSGSSFQKIVIPK